VATEGGASYSRAAMTYQNALVRRLGEVLRKWPVDRSRKGRDLGEFLSKSYKLKFQDEVLTDVSSIN